MVSYDYSHSLALSDPNYVSKGLIRSQQLENLWQYGPCEHKVEIPTLFEYLFSEMTGPLFMLQYVICIIYIAEAFYFFAGMVIGTSILTTIINYFLLRNSLSKIKEIAERNVEVHVVRDGR